MHVDLQSLDRRLTSLELAQNEQGPSGNARRNRNRSNRSKAQRKSPVGDAEPWQQRGALAGDARRVPLSTWPGPPLQPIDDTWGVNNAHDNNASHNYIHDFDEGDNDSTGPLAKALQPEAQSKIASLPAEIVRRILVYASEACMDASFTDLQQWSKGAWDSWKDDEHGHASSVVDRKGYPAVQSECLSQAAAVRIDLIPTKHYLNRMVVVLTVHLQTMAADCSGLRYAKSTHCDFWNSKTSDRRWVEVCIVMTAL